MKFNAVIEKKIFDSNFSDYQHEEIDEVLVRIFSENIIPVDKDNIYTPLELRDCQNINKNTQKIRCNIIANQLRLKNVNYYCKKKIKKDITITVYYLDEEPIYIDMLGRKKIIDAMAKIKNDDNLIGNGDVSYYHHVDDIGEDYINSIDGVHFSNKTEEKKPLTNKHYSERPMDIKIFLDLPYNNNIFDYNDIHEKNNMLHIENKKLPHYQLMRKNKFNLLNILGKHSLNLCPEDLNYYLLHDKIPFINHQHLRGMLKEYHSMPEISYEKKSEKYEEEACKYMLANKERMMLENQGQYEVYSKEEFEEGEKETNREKYIIDFDKFVSNYFQMHLDIVSNKDLLNIEIVNGKAVNHVDKNLYHSEQGSIDDADKQGHYHRGFYDSPLLKSHNKYINYHRYLDLKPNINIDIFPASDNFNSIIICYNQKELDLDSFYISDDRQSLVKTLIMKIWKRGLFLSSFARAYYTNTNIILSDQLVIPNWLKSGSVEDFDALVSYINSL